MRAQTENPKYMIAVFDLILVLRVGFNQLLCENMLVGLHRLNYPEL